MSDESPKAVAINHDDYAARYIGRTVDGRQFILTTPFEPAIQGRSGAEYLALYLFDDTGILLDAKIEDFGPRGKMDVDRREQLRDLWLKELGDISYERIEVAPFSVNRFGTEFGLVIRERVDEHDPWAVEMLPGNYMAFFEPWESGDYDT